MNADEGVGQDRRDAQDREGDRDVDRPGADEGHEQGDQRQLGDRPAGVTGRDREQLAGAAVTEQDAGWDAIDIQLTASPSGSGFVLNGLKLFIPFALLNSFFILIASVAAGAALAWAFSLPLATMIIATSPGGLAEMTILAQALQISVPLVIAFHLFRVVVVNIATQYIYFWMARLLGWTDKDF